jgi:tetratricopeptide (TPR) repeat protein
MPRRLWVATLSVWPGLPQIWTGQEVLGLMLAALFALATNLAISSHLIWREAFGLGLPTFFLALAIGTWCAGLGYTLWWSWRCHPERYTGEIDRLFRDSNEHYLQGHWNEARLGYERILSLDETDADALMQLGTICVRVGRVEDARRNFRQCLELEGGLKWRWEIEQALAVLDQVDERGEAERAPRRPRTGSVAA